VPKLSVNFEEILSPAYENFEKQKKVLVHYTIVVVVNCCSNWGCCFFLFGKKILKKTFSSMSRVRPATARPAPANTADRSDLCKNVSLAVLFGSNGNLYTVCTLLDVCVCVCVHTHTHTFILHSTETLVGQCKDTNWNCSECRMPKSCQACYSPCVLLVFD